MARPKVTNKPPAFQWYPKDVLTDPVVVNMSLEAEGAYRRLIDVCWLENGLPTEADHLWRLAKCRSRAHFTKLWVQMRTKFVERDTRWQHKRLDIERRRQAAWRAKCAKGGRKSAARRWPGRDKGSSSKTRVLLQLDGNSSSSSAVRTETPLPPLKGGPRITRAERTTAIGILTRNLGNRCPHDPRCHTSEHCVELIAWERRAKAQAS